MKSKKTNEKKLSTKVTAVKKNVKNIYEFYYMSPTEMNAREWSLCIASVPEEQVEIWTELNLVEVVLANDSLIFQDARECFVDPLDLEYIRDNDIKTIYQISYDAMDQSVVRIVMKEILEQKGGRICSDTDDFEPVFTLENVDKLDKG